MSDQFFSEISREAVRATRGTVLMRQGEIGRSAYFVVEGKLLVEREVEGVNFILGEIGPRDIVGELAILDDAPRSATVTVSEDSLLVMLDKNRIKQIIRRSPVVAELILKLICYKLRSAHRILSHFNDIENPAVWLKIVTILQLCSQATRSPDQLYFSFLQNLKRIAEIPIHRLRDVLERLSLAKIITAEGRNLQIIHQDRMEIFLKQGQEDFANEDIQSPTQMKIYRASRYLLDQFCRDIQNQDSETLGLDRLLQILATSTLWSDLRPALQNQRAQNLVQFFLQQGYLEWTQQDKGTIRVPFPKLKEVSAPSQEIVHYEEVKTVLFFKRKS